jgi:hypothetical protein
MNWKSLACVALLVVPLLSGVVQASPTPADVPAATLSWSTMGSQPGSVGTIVMEGSAVVVADPTVTTVTADVVSISGRPALSSLKIGKRMSFRERRKLGFTFVNVRRVVKEMDAAGELDRDDPDGIAAQVMARLIAEKPAEFQKVAAERDWAEFFDALLAFIEKILPIIMQFFSFVDAGWLDVSPMCYQTPGCQAIPLLPMAA